MSGFRCVPYFAIVFAGAFFMSLPSAYSAKVCEQWISTDMKRKELLRIVEDAIRTSSKKILKIRKSRDFDMSHKEHLSDIKTKGDCTSQETILNLLSKNEITKHANYIAEEKCIKTNHLTDKKDATVKATWVLDPIDGTTNFAHGMPHFGISLALIVDENICFGAVYAPVYDELFYAFDGHGAFLKTSAVTAAERIKVSSVKTLQDSLWITGTEGGPKIASFARNKATFDAAQALLPKTHDLRRTGSASLDLSAVASGRAEAYFELSDDLSWWDITAGLVLIKEAGGKVFVRETQPSESTSEAAPKAADSPLLEKRILYVLGTNGAPEIEDTIKRVLDEKTAKLK